MRFQHMIALIFFLVSPTCFAAGGRSDDVANGRRLVSNVRNAYASTNVTTSAWVELVHSMPLNTGMIEIFDSSGQTLKIGFGASGSEVVQFLVYPGGNGMIPVRVTQDTRVSIKAVSGTASTGEIDVNFYE